MRKSLLSLQLDDDQIDELIAALCAYRDHFVELIELNAEVAGPHARENDQQWESKIRQVQEMIDQINESLYGSSSGHPKVDSRFPKVDVSQDLPDAA